jgi:hypothetical protein
VVLHKFEIAGHARVDVKRNPERPTTFHPTAHVREASRADLGDSGRSKEPKDSGKAKAELRIQRNLTILPVRGAASKPEHWEVEIEP